MKRRVLPPWSVMATKLLLASKRLMVLPVLVPPLLLAVPVI